MLKGISMKNLIFLLLVLSTAACSMNKEQKSQELASSEKEDFTINDDVLVFDDGADMELERTITGISKVEADSIYDDQNKIKGIKNEIAREVASIEQSHFLEYTVEDGDTLMLVAFKIYRDSDKWKHISMWNEDLLKGRTQLQTGQQLKYIPEDSIPNWPPNGDPYLILRGDYLTKISKKLYQDNGKHWKNIWENNKVQITDPNLIFAGFTLYYLPKEQVLERGPANF